MNIKSLIRNNELLWRFVRKLRRWASPIISHPVSAWFRYLRFFNEMRRYREMGGSASMKDAFPCLHDHASETGFDPQYFYQAYWAMEKLRAYSPGHHVDVGSDVKFVGMLSAWCKVTFVDIRPLRVDLPNLESRAGSILELPYTDGELSSLSSLHVIEHIGLGRYGDPLDPAGSDKACAELVRVIAPGGRLLVSMPVGSPRIQFNGQRVFAIDEALGLFGALRMESFSLVDNFGAFHEDVQPQGVVFDEARGQDFALGCFEFVKVD